MPQFQAQQHHPGTDADSLTLPEQSPSACQQPAPDAVRERRLERELDEGVDYFAVQGELDRARTEGRIA